MPRYIDADALKERKNKVYDEEAAANCGDFDFAVMLDDIDDIPTADVVPVVRCKHRLFFRHDRQFSCMWHLSQVGPEGFCSYGEKKDGDT